MSFALLWARGDLRRRWRALVVMLLLVTLATTVVFTALAAARRGASAISRLQARTLPATVDVLPNTPGFDWSKIRSLPEVAALSNFIVDYSMEAEGFPNMNLGFPFTDSTYLSTLEKPVVLAGRNLNPARADEAVVTKGFEKQYHRGVGDTVTIRLPTAKQLGDSFAGADPSALTGPQVRVRIVGVVVSPWLTDSPSSSGGLQVSAGLAAKYPLETIGVPGPHNTQFINALVRLRHGEADVARFRDDLARVTGRGDIYVGDLVKMYSDLQGHIAFESRCLLAFGLAALVAALVLVGQALSRQIAGSVADLRALRASGLTTWQTVPAAAIAPVVAASLGLGIGAVLAYVVSDHFPFGTAAIFEPSPGRDFDAVVTSAGLGIVLLLLVTGAALMGRLAVRASRVERAARNAILAEVASRAHAPIPVVIGTRFALETGRGKTAVPVRPALIGAVVGVLGTVAAFTFSHGVSDAAHHPERYGQTFQLGTFMGIDNHDYGPAASVDHFLATNSDVAGYDDARTAVATNPAGTTSVSLWEFESRPKPLKMVLLSGREPAKADEVVLAPHTLSDLHAHVGQYVELKGSRSGTQRMLVTGDGFAPIGPHNDYSEGGWVTTAGYNSLFSGFKFHLQLIKVAPGVSVAAAQKRLGAEVGKAVPAAAGLPFVTPDPPDEAFLIQHVERLPVLLAIFLALLAIGAVGHALASAVRRRAHDLAVLRALGMTPRQCRLIVVTQATVLGLVGLAFGVPLGVAVGRSVWRVVADLTPLQYVPPLAVTVLLLVAPATIVATNVLAAWPGRRAARLRVAQVLRAE